MSFSAALWKFIRLHNSLRIIPRFLSAAWLKFVNFLLLMLLFDDVFVVVSSFSLVFFLHIRLKSIFSCFFFDLIFHNSILITLFLAWFLMDLFFRLLYLIRFLLFDHYYRWIVRRSGFFVETPLSRVRFFVVSFICYSIIFKIPWFVVILLNLYSFRSQSIWLFSLPLKLSVSKLDWLFGAFCSFAHLKTISTVVIDVNYFMRLPLDRYSECAKGVHVLLKIKACIFLGLLWREVFFLHSLVCFGLEEIVHVILIHLKNSW